MTEGTQRALSLKRKIRGVTRASITKLGSRVEELEDAAILPETADLARRLTKRLEVLSAEFKGHHFEVLDLVEGERDLGREQEVFDKQDEEISQLTARLEKLVSSCSVVDSEQHKIAFKRLKHIEKGLTAIRHSISPFPRDGDIHTLQQFEEQLSGYKKDFSDVQRSLFSLDIEDSSDLGMLIPRVEDAMFRSSLEIRKLLHSHSTPSTSDIQGVKLPKLDVPTFDGSLLNWKTFWEQFKVAVHIRTNLTDSEKLAYLRHALKAGSAKSVIEGLSRSGDHYAEAVSCLQARYDRPRLIHQAHVKKILEIPNLRDGNGKELRRLHDTALQHLRALRSLGHEPSGAFITSMLELKLDVNTMFEWQRHSHSSADVPDYQELLEFVNLRAQALEAAVSDTSRKPVKSDHTGRKPSTPIASNAGSADTNAAMCVACKAEKHPLFVCSHFKSLSHADKTSLLKSNSVCFNCLRPGHQVKGCKSLHKCRVCQKPHHTLLHIEAKGGTPPPTSANNFAPTVPSSLNPTTPGPVPAPISSNTTMGIQSDVLIMTCRVLAESSDGSAVEARAILDSGSSASFVSERLAQCLNLRRSHQNTRITGVAGFVRNSSQPIASLQIASLHRPGAKFTVTAVVVPCVTSDLPLQPISFDHKWNHLSNLRLADPNFGLPGRIDLLLGVDIFAEVILHGRRQGPQGSPVAIETQLGWVLAGSTNSCVTPTVATHHTMVHTGDDLLRCFWEVERLEDKYSLTPEESEVVEHFKTNHTRLEDGRFVVPLPRKLTSLPLGESRSQAVRRFLSFERSLHSKGLFTEFKAVIDEYFDQGHAELVPVADFEKPPHSVFYLPMHAVTKQSSTTTKVRAVFDASAKTSSGVSLNDTLMVGPTVHSSLVDVLLRFRWHRVALVADVSRMYRAIALTPQDRDLHRFVWRNAPNLPLQDFRMTRITFGVSASSFVANMCVKQNAQDYTNTFPLAAKAVDESFYVDDGLTGADSKDEAIQLQNELQTLFGKGGFLLRKWNSSEPDILEQIAPELCDQQSVCTISEPDSYTKTLGIEWGVRQDHFRLTVADLPPHDSWTKRALTSDIAKTFDILGWFAPVIVKAKIILQRL